MDEILTTSEAHRIIDEYDRKVRKATAKAKAQLAKVGVGVGDRELDERVLRAHADREFVRRYFL